MRDKAGPRSTVSHHKWMVALGLVILSVASTLTIFAVLGLRP